MTIDIKNFYLGTPMTYYQYIRVKPETSRKRSGTTHDTTSPLKPMVTSTWKYEKACMASKKPVSSLSTN